MDISTILDAYVSHQLQLVEWEREAEIAEEEKYQSSYSDVQLQRKGICLVGLRVTGSRTGLGGKTLVDLEKEIGTATILPSHTMRPGDLVGIKPYSKDITHKTRQENKNEWKDYTSIVYRVSDTRLTLSFNHDLPEDLLSGSYRITVSHMISDVTFQRMKSALNYLVKANSTGISRLISILFNQRIPTFSTSLPTIKKWHSPLNSSQKTAVEFTASAQDIALLHGPPGTGKTTTLAEIIHQVCTSKSIVGRNKKILVCAPSNIAVDTLVEKLAINKLSLVRIGHPARILPSILPYSLDNVVFNSDAGKLLRDTRDERDDVLKQMQKKTTTKGERRLLYDQLKILKKELISREKTVIQDVLNQSQIILATLSGCGSHHLKDQFFDMIVIDEVSQAKEAECWNALLKGNNECKLILAGDPCQLPPTIKSTKAEKAGMATTLFDRCVKLYGNTVKSTLTIQYRMNEKIMQWSNKEFYEGKVVADDHVKNHVLLDIEGITDSPYVSCVLVMIDTAGCNMPETYIEQGEEEEEESSKMNDGEACIVKKYVVQLIKKSGCLARHIAIITPYQAQVSLISGLLKNEYPELEINTVDGFQGREKEIVILSLVRSNETGNVGFLREKRRLNVAITRAKRHVCLIGDSETLQRGDPFLGRLVDYFNEHGDVYSAQQLVDN